MSLRPIDPVVLTLQDGQERKFLLTLGSIRRLKSRFGVKNIQEFFARDIEECGVPILWEALLDKDGITEDQLADQMPMDLEWFAAAMAAIFRASQPDETTTRPPAASPATETAGTGLQCALSGSDASTVT